MLNYLVSSFIVIILPGTGVIYTLSVGLKAGKISSLFAAFGCTLGIVPHILVSLTGLATLFASGGAMTLVVSYAGAAYLVYLAYKTAMTPIDLNLDAGFALSMSKKSVVRDGFMINILNPKLIFFFLAFLPQFIDKNRSDVLSQMIYLSTIFVGMTFVVFVQYGLFASFARKYIIQHGAILKFINYLFAALFVLLAIRILLESGFLT